jgi:hypothetical protein
MAASPGALPPVMRAGVRVAGPQPTPVLVRSTGVVRVVLGRVVLLLRAPLSRDDRGPNSGEELVEPVHQKTPVVRP